MAGARRDLGEFSSSSSWARYSPDGWDRQDLLRVGKQPRSLVVQSPRRRFLGSTTTKGRARRYLSSVPFVTVHLACALALVYPPTWHLALLAIGSYLLRMWAITVGYHRYLSHRSFRTSRAFQFVPG